MEKPQEHPAASFPWWLMVKGQVSKAYSQHLHEGLNKGRNIAEVIHTVLQPGFFYLCAPFQILPLDTAIT